MQVVSELLGRCPAIEALREKLRHLLERPQAGQRVAPILLQGETGTGKGLVARLIHRVSPRRDGPFVDINCAAIPEGLFEAEMFGFERGAFTDARHAKPGLFQTAHRGTLFLDEVALVPAPLQAKLLTAIEEHVVRRLGSTRTELVDAWIISASNTDLRAAVRARHFREDLYHRLAVITLSLPALRHRGQDIVLLAEHFLARACVDYGLPPKRLASPAKARLLAYAWPGNIRELANVIERAVLFTESPVVTAEMLEPLEEPIPRHETESSPDAGHVISPEEAMRQHLLAALEQAGWNISQTAARLGIARNTLYARLEKLGLRTEPAPRVRSGLPSSRAPSAVRGHPPVQRVSSRTQLRWESRELTLFQAFVRIRESSGSASRISRIIEVVIDKVHSFGGRVEELAPTAVVAVFGLDPVEDAPRRAAHASLSIHKAAERDSGDEVGSEVTIALHVAPVLVGQAGALTQIDPAAKSEQQLVLDGLVAASDGRQIVLSAAAAPFLERRFELTAVEGIDAKRPAAFRLTGRERRGFGLWGETTEFVGRQDEVHTLQSRLALARDARGQLVAVVGEAGVGKSRLVWEFTRSASLHGCLVLESGAVSYGKTKPYLAIVGLLKTYFGIGDRDDEHALVDKISGKLLALDARFAATMPAFLGLLDLPVDDAAWHALDPLQRRQRTQDAVKSLLRWESRRQVTVLVVEDLHWIDGETQSVLNGLADGLLGSRLLLVVSYRPEYAHDWGGKTYYTQLRIDPLPTTNATELLDGLLGSDPGLDSVKRMLVARTAGNPFFLEESVRTLVETQALAGERRAYRLAEPVNVVQLPPTVRAVLATRIDRLPSDEKRLLRAAAVIGTDVPFPLIQAVAELSEPDLRRLLASLQAGELLYESGLSPDLQYSFRHALTHEIAYEGLPADLRRTLHARILGAIEARHPDRLTEHAERLTRHAVRAEHWEKAARYGRQAALKALAQSANREAVAYLRQALSAVARVPDSRWIREMAIDLRLDLYGALLPLDELRPLLDSLRDAEALALALEDLPRLRWVRLHICHLLVLTDEMHPGVELGHELLAAAEASGDHAVEAGACLWLGCAYYAIGQHWRAVEFLGKSRAILENGELRSSLDTSMLTVRWPPGGSPGYHSMFLGELGEFARGATVGADVLRIVEARDRPWGFAIVCWQVGHLYCTKGDFDRALPLLERAIAVAQEWGYARTVGLTSCVHGYALALSGHAVKGVLQLEQGMRQSDAVGLTWLRGQRLNQLGEAYLLAGRVDDAYATAKRSVELCSQRGERGFEAWALRLLAEIVSRRAPSDMKAATELYTSAMALAAELEMRPLIAHCHLGLGKLYRRIGSDLEADEHLAHATRMYREMGMTYWLQQAEEETSGRR